MACMLAAGAIMHKVVAMAAPVHFVFASLLLVSKTLAPLWLTSDDSLLVLLDVSMKTDNITMSISGC